MAFPSVRSSSSGSNDSNSTNQPITLPATIEAGDLILACLNVDSTATITWDQSSFGTWAQEAGSNYSGARFNLFVKVADGNEDGGTLTPTTSTSQQSAWICYAIRDWFGDLAGVETATTTDTGGGSSAPDPPNLTPSWGSADDLWLSFAGMDGGGTLSNFPYANNQLADDGNDAANGVGIAACTKTATAASDDPAAWTLSAAEQWFAFTTAIRPAAGALAGGASLTLAGSGALAGAGLLAGSGAIALAAAAAVAGSGVLAGNVACNWSASAALAGGGALAAGAALAFDVDGALTGTGADALAGQAALAWSALGTVAAGAALAGNAAAAFAVAPVLLGQAALAGTGALMASAQAAAAAQGVLAGSADIDFNLTLMVGPATAHPMRTVMVDLADRTVIAQGAGQTIVVTLQ